MAVPKSRDRLRLGCMKKSGSLPQFLYKNWVFRVFSLATLALRHLLPSVLNVSKKYPGREKPMASNKREKDLRY